MRLVGRRIVGQHGAAAEGANLEQRPGRLLRQGGGSGHAQGQDGGQHAAHGDARSATSSTFGKGVRPQQGVTETLKPAASNGAASA